MTEQPWTEEDEKQLKELRRRKAKHLRDATRVRKYGPKKRVSE